SFDLTAGIFNTSKPVADGPIDLIRFQSERGHFLSAHAAAQTNLWRKAFASASFLISARNCDFDLDESQAVSPVVKALLSPPYHQNFVSKFSNVGVGWKFKPNLITEYTLLLDYNRRVPSHSLLMRYTFDVNIFGEK